MKPASSTTSTTGVCLCDTQMLLLRLVGSAVGVHVQLLAHLQGLGSACGFVVCPVLGCVTFKMSVAACTCKTSRQAMVLVLDQHRPHSLALWPSGRPLVDLLWCGHCQLLGVACTGQLHEGADCDCPILRHLC